MKLSTKPLLTLTAFGAIASVGALHAEPEVIVTPNGATTVVETPATVVVDPAAAPVPNPLSATVKETTVSVDGVPVATDKQVKIGQATPTPTTVQVVPAERRVILIKELGAVVTDRGPLISLGEEVLFDYDKSDIKPEAAAELEKVAELIRLSGDYYVEIAGYTDDHGSKEYNSDLAWERSLSVVNWFTSQEAFPAAQFRAIGRGEEGDVAPNTEVNGSDNPEGRALNRRVEILIRDQEARADYDKSLKPGQ